jgi:hypothetical protein
MFDFCSQLLRHMTYPRCQGFRSLQQRFPQHLYCSEAVFRNAIAALKVRGMLGRVSTLLIPQIIC